MYGEDYEFTPAPTPGYEPVDDLSIPDVLNECLLGVLPPNQDQVDRKRKKKKKRRKRNDDNSGGAVTIPAKRHLEESGNELSISSQDAHSHGFGYISPNDLVPSITSYSGDHNIDADDYTTQYILDFLYDDDDEIEDDTRRMQEQAENFDRDAVCS